MTLQLRPYQDESLQAIEEAKQRGVMRQLLALPTGGGKTVVFAEQVRRTLARPGARALVLAHRDRLIEQAHAKLSNVLGDLKAGIIKGPVNHINADVIVGSVQTLVNDKRLNSLPEFDLVIIDEAHRSAAKVYRKIIDKVVGPQTLLLGVTATPNRTDGIALQRDAENPGGIYEEIVYQVGMLDLIRDGYLAPLVGKQIVLDVNFSGLHSKRGIDGISDYKQDEVANLMEAANWHQHVAEAWVREARERRTIAFVPRVAMAYQIAEHLQGLGIRAAALDGSRTLGEQRRTVAEFERGEIDFLANCDLFVEGADIPSINCVLFARPTKSRIIYSQAIGRGTRLSPETGKTDCLVLDVVGAANRHDLCTLGTLAGVRKLGEGEDLVKAVEREKEEDRKAEEQRQFKYEQLKGQLMAREVSLFGGIMETPAPRNQTFTWEIDRERKIAYLLQQGTRVYCVWKDDDGLYYYSGLGKDQYWRGRSGAYQEAEDLCLQRAKEQRFGGADAPWRSRPASQKQIDLLKRMHVPFPQGVTQGQAADLLDKRFERNRQKAKADL